MNVIQSDDGVNWGKKVTFDERCKGGPAIKDLGNDLVWAWTSVNGNINTLIQNWSL